MILLDDRERDLLPAFKPFGDCTVETTRLEAGDVCFQGNGPDGEGTLLIGIERKKIGDLVNSMRDRRLGAFQAPLVASTYDIRYLVVEGIWQLGAGGALEELRGRDWRAVAGRKREPVLWREVDSFLSSLEEFFSFRIKQTKNERETAAWVVSRYKYWQKRYDQHHTHQQVYAPVPDRGTGKKAGFISLEQEIRALYGPRGVLIWKMSAQYDGIDRKANEVAKMFCCPTGMTTATVKDWLRIPGVGDKLAKQITEINCCEDCRRQ